MTFLRNISLGLFLIYTLNGAARWNAEEIDSLAIVAFHLQATDLNVSFSIAKEIYQDSKKLDYKKGLGYAATRLGSIYNDFGQNDSSIYYLKQAFRIRQELKDTVGCTGLCIQLSYVYRETGQIDSAYHALFKALRLTPLSADTATFADILIELGNLSLDYNENKKAKTYLDSARLLCENQSDLFLLKKLHTSLGRYYFETYDFVRALEYFKTAESLARSLDNPMEIARSLNNLAAVYERLLQSEKAKQYYQEALLVYQKLNIPYEEATTMNSLGALYYEQKDWNKALEWYLRSFKVSESIKDLKLISQAHMDIADTYNHIQDYENALIHYKLHKQYSDSILNGQKIRSIAEMQTKYETEQKEQHISLLNAQSKTRTAQRNLSFAGSGILLLGLATLTFYYVQRKKLAHQNEELAKERINSLLNEQEIKTYNAMIEGQEEERQRIATDLHDRVGSMLSAVKLSFSAINDIGNEKHLHLEKMVDEACVEVRRISHNLSTGMVKTYGLTGALQELCDRLNPIIPSKLMIYNMNEPLDFQTELGLYRMIQEMLNNILKHAQATQVTIQINIMEEELSLTVEDNGIGFNPNAGTKKGIGLKNLQARAQKMEGTFNIDSAPGRGTICIVEIPLKTKNYD